MWKNQFHGKVKVVTGRRGIIGIFDENNRQIKKYDVPGIDNVRWKLC
jgi:DNA-directed RNA polymerase subunit beta'